MAEYANLTKKDANLLAAEYGLPKVVSVRTVREGSVNTHYLLETGRGRFVVKIDEVKSEIEDKRELDLLLFLRKYGFPCPVALADRRGRHCRDWNGRQLSMYRHIDGHAVDPEDLTGVQLENIGRVMADLHLITKAYKKGVDSRFNFDRVAEIYSGVRGRLPHYLKKIVRTLDEELEYLQNYLENKLPKGIIHGDIFADNVMIKGDKVVAVLDFEAAGRGKFIFDLATAVNALCFEGGRYALKRFESLIAGYEAPASSLPPSHAVNVPGISVTVAEMVEALRRVAGDAVADRVLFRHDETIDRIVRTWPRDFDAKVGRALGMCGDASFEAIVRQYVEHDRPG